MMGRSQVAAFTATQKNIGAIINIMLYFYKTTWMYFRPGEKDALHHVEVLHQHISLRFGAQVAHGVADPQLDGTFQGWRCGLSGGEVKFKLPFPIWIQLFAWNICFAKLE